jgi:hypothetical protein
MLGANQSSEDGETGGEGDELQEGEAAEVTRDGVSCALNRKDFEALRRMPRAENERCRSMKVLFKSAAVPQRTLSSRHHDDHTAGAPVGDRVVNSKGEEDRAEGVALLNSFPGERGGVRAWRGCCE